MDTLVLDRNWQPVGFVGWQRAIKLVWEGRAQVIKEDEGGQVLHSPCLTMGMPRIIVVKNVWAKRRRTQIPCTRRNLLIRDHATCQYCGRVIGTHEYTIDHVIPRCQGGKTTWENAVIACVRDNNRKDGRTPEQAGMPLLNKPVVPKPNDPRFNFRLHVTKLRPEWKDYEQYIYAEKASFYYYNVELEP